MFHSFLTFINQLGVDLHKQRSLLTVSGGIDSVVMAHLFQRAGFKAGIAHCNFGLRGEESDMDEAFVRNLAASYGFPFFVKHFETKAYAKKKGISTQMAARDLRYSWFREIGSDGFEWIATAHHVNDSLETVLLNLVRGTGIAGLHGISPINGNLLRPMLFATKDEILQYAEKHGLSWREDRSNMSLDYKRNIIRKKVVPVLEELNPSLTNTFGLTSEKVASAQGLLGKFLVEWRNRVVKIDGGFVLIPIAALETEENATYLLWSVLEPLGFTYIQCKQVCAALDATSGGVYFSATHELLKEREMLVVRKQRNGESENEVLISGPGAFRLGQDIFRLEEKAACNASDISNETIFLDAKKINLPLRVRIWKQGDFFSPFGMKGKRKKISDLLIDLKFSRFAKENVKVLVDQDDEIVWLVGIRASELTRVAFGGGEFYQITHQFAAE